MRPSLIGIAASNGIAFGKAYKLITPDLTFKKVTIKNSDEEINKFHSALLQAHKELKRIRQKMADKQGDEYAAIFDAQLLVLQDPEFISLVEEKINKEKINAESALHDISEKYINELRQLHNEYMRERAIDIKDVTTRILAHLLHQPLPHLELITEETIIIANDLTPSDVAQMNSQHVKGIVTSIGGRTSHVSIMARSMELPAVVGTETAARTIENGDDIIVDGNNGIIWINPTSRIQKIYKQRQQDFQAEKLAWSLLKNKPTITRDQHQVALVANISSSDEIENVLANGAEGIGLYRTEYLFMEKSTFPTEEEQFEVYKTVLKRMNDKPVVVRTLDIGGDKQLPYWNLPKEMNPFLGVRAIRLSLQEMDIFRTQLRALLRASSFGNLKIMFPMIAVIDEFLQAKQVLLEEKQKLHDQGIRVEKNIEIGIMVEIPATALLANQFAKEVDFFSIGTNDLIQYMFAADRLNEHVSYLYQPYHPAILRLIKLIIDAAHDEGKWVGMCGEMAGDPNAIPLLLGLGLDEFSMGASSILPARNHLKKLSKQDMEKLAQKALSLRTANDVLKLVHEH